MARAARQTSFVDPLAIAFAAAQQAYKSGLAALIDAKRRARGLGPIEWPAIGATPHDELWRDGAARLLRYRGAGSGPPVGPPVLLVASLINRPWVLDLLPGRSVVEKLLEGGLDVWLLDWGTPRAEDAGRDLAGYALDRLPRAFDEVARIAGATPFVLGYCMGGTLALLAAGAERIAPAGIVALATPVALHDEGLLSRWCRTPGFDPSEMRRAYGNIPPYLLQPAFKMLDPVGLISKWVHLDEKIGDEAFLGFFLAMESWLEDSVSFPGDAFVDWVELYRSDGLARGGLELGGARIDLGRVRCPLFNVMAEKDYITPPASSEPLEKLLRGPYASERLKGGHIGLSTGGEAHKRLWPAVARWMRDHASANANANAKPKRVMRTHQKKKVRR
jgi:polyhydroxyalkanoate synthase subunit PhaC